MPSTLTFGVELEFLMAFLPDDTPPPDPSELRLLRFAHTEADIQAYHHLTHDTSSSRDTDENGGRLMCAKRHIRHALAEAGLSVISVERTEYDRSDYSGWDIVEDSSIEKPEEDTPYGYFQMEVRSPAYIFSPQALLEVRAACQALTDNFCLLSVATSSVHVHVGDGERSFGAETMSRLAAFVWAFEPQLHSIHPPHRQDTFYATGIRESSKYSTQYQDRYDRVPSGITGALDLYACADMESLCAQVVDGSGYLKTCQVSLTGIKSAATDPSHPKKTVEWRQHEGTLDGEQITHWLSTAVGIMYFVRDAPVQYFFDVLSFALLETWQKVGDGRDGEREVRLGPILAERCFPINKLLRLLMLDEQAEFYEGRWYKLDKTPPKEGRRSRIEWEYEQRCVAGSRESERSYGLRRLWEDLRILKDMPLSLGLLFDPDDPMWPSHSLRIHSPEELQDQGLVTEVYFNTLEAQGIATESNKYPETDSDCDTVVGTESDPEADQSS